LDFDLFSLDEEQEELLPEVEEEVTLEIEETLVESEEQPFEMISAVEEVPVETPKEKEVASNRHFSGTIHPIYTKLDTNDDTLAGRLLRVRLETLKGAFGFNERMQIVQELFGGSSETFNDAIEELDALDNKEQSRVLVSSFAAQYEWDAENEMALEFIQKVERRYA
jgi:hypothetical protein